MTQSPDPPPSLIALRIIWFAPLLVADIALAVQIVNFPTGRPQCEA
jgi:hypothetical protein